MANAKTLFVMTERGQIVIPQAIRKALDLHEGDIIIAEFRKFVSNQPEKQ